MRRLLLELAGGVRDLDWRSVIQVLPELWSQEAAVCWRVLSVSMETRWQGREVPVLSPGKGCTCATRARMPLAVFQRHQRAIQMHARSQQQTLPVAGEIWPWLLHTRICRNEPQRDSKRQTKDGIDDPRRTHLLLQCFSRSRICILFLLREQSQVETQQDQLWPPPSICCISSRRLQARAQASEQ